MERTLEASALSMGATDLRASGMAGSPRIRAGSGLKKMRWDQGGRPKRTERSAV